MQNGERLFKYDEDGLFEIADGSDAARLNGGIQTEIGAAGVAEVASGFFCSNDSKCK